MARSQTVPFSEIICYDDGSTDDTVAVAHTLGVTIIRGCGCRGPAFARNRLLEATKSRWVHFHDVDDQFEPNFVQEMSAVLTGPNHGAICDLRISWADYSHKDEIVRYQKVRTETDLVKYFLETFVHLDSVVYPTHLLRRIGGFYEYLRFCEDRDIQVRIANTKIEFVYVGSPLVTWHRQPKSYMARHDLVYKMKFNRWFLHRCYRKFGPKYYSILGNRASGYAWDFFHHNERNDSRLCIRFARRCGVMIYSNLKLREVLLVRAFGPEFLFWLKQNWFLLRQSASRLRGLSFLKTEAQPNASLSRS
jgi:glycosyltransferase involved in cell wall biosynthesis